MGFPGGSAGKESACNAGDMGSVSGSRRSPREGTINPLQAVKNLPAIWETWIQSLGWEDSPEKGTATHFSILAWRIPWTV